MPDLRRIGTQHYYDLLLFAGHRCGDIWSGINSMGLLGRLPLSGLVVTPDCDLTQRKTETVTFLPILSILQYFSTLAALPEVRNAVEASLRGGDFDLRVPWGDHRFRPPSRPEVSTFIDRIDLHLQSKQRGQRQVDALQRAIAGLQIILTI